MTNILNNKHNKMEENVQCNECKGKIGLDGKPIEEQVNISIK
jgi:hypothetical protein